MTSTFARGSLVLSIFALALLLPISAHAGCSTQCANGSCSSTLPDAVCCCDKAGNALCGAGPAPDCGGVGLAFDSSPEELAAFKLQIDAWQTSDSPEIRQLAAVAADVHSAVLFQDNDAFRAANAEFLKTLASLSPKSLQQVQKPADKARE